MKVNVNVMKYDMGSFLEQCVERYIELAGSKIVGKIKPCTTPFLDESKAEFDENDVITKIKAARSALPADKTPAQIAAVSQGGGMLSHIASAVLMKILYAARMGRFDLLRPVTALGSRITTWTKLCDQRLHRLVCYIKGTITLKMYGWVGDKREDLELVLYCDADLAGDRNDAKSTSGIFMCLVGPTSFVPLVGVSKKQTSVSKSTPEAEIVAIDHGLAKHALPALSLWESILGKQMTIALMEDNSAACRIVITGRNPSMRHMSRTQRIDIAWLNERYADKTFRFVECPSEYQAGDLMTKHFTDAKVWERNLCLVGHFHDDVFAKAFNKVGCAATLTIDEVTESTDVPTDSTHISTTSAAASAVHVPQRFAKYVIQTVTYEYTLIEFCCFEDSRLGNPKFHKGICRVVKITLELDGCSRKAMELMRLVCSQDQARVVLWSSLPCTGGCTWNYINGRTPEGRAKIEAHVKIMVSLLVNFICAAKLIIRNGGIVCFEWPRYCMYWKRKDIIDMIKTLGLTQTTFCGCAVGLHSFTPGNEHMFLKKPWCIYSNSGHIHQIFSKFVCPGVDKNHIHDQCRGVNAKGSERYTDTFAAQAHRAFRLDFNL